MCYQLLLRFSKCNFYFNIDWEREGGGRRNYFFMFILTLRKARAKTQSVLTILSRVVKSNEQLMFFEFKKNMFHGLL